MKKLWMKLIEPILAYRAVRRERRERLNSARRWAFWMSCGGTVRRG